MLVVGCGAELFTGSSLLAKAALHAAITWAQLVENRAVVVSGSLAGSSFFVWLMFRSNLWEAKHLMGYAIRIAATKNSPPFKVALILGILCNCLAFLADFMVTEALDITVELLPIYAPTMAFVAFACWFVHLKETCAPTPEPCYRCRSCINHSASDGFAGIQNFTHEETRPAVG